MQHCKHMQCALLLGATGTWQSHIFTLVDFSLLPPHFILPPFCFPACPVPEPSVWTDCDIGCVGDRPAGVISEVEKNRSASLYLTPSLLPPAADEGRTDWRWQAILFIYFSKGSYLSWRAVLSSRSIQNSINKENCCRGK